MSKLRIWTGVAIAVIVVLVLGWFAARSWLGTFYYDKAVAAAQTENPDCRTVAAYAGKALKFVKRQGELAYWGPFRQCILEKSTDSDKDIALLRDIYYETPFPYLKSISLTFMAHEYLLRGDCDTAVSAAQEALGLSSFYSEVWRILGWGYFCKRDFKNAEGAYKEALKSGTNIFALNGLAVSYMAQTPPRFNEAIPLLEEAIAKKPTYPSPYYNLGFGYYVFEKNYAKTVEYLEKLFAVLKNPDGSAIRWHIWETALAHGMLADAYNAIGKPENAGPHFEAFLDIISRNPGFNTPEFREKQIPIEISLFESLVSKAERLK